MFENIYENGTDGMLIQIRKNITNYKKESEV